MMRMKLLKKVFPLFFYRAILDPSEESNPQLDFSVKSGEKLTLDLKTLHIPKKHRDISIVPLLFFYS